MKKTFWAAALAALAAAPGGAAAANGESGLLRQMPAAEARQGAAGQSMGFVFQQVRPCAEESGRNRPEEDFSVLYLDRAPESDNEEWENIACKSRAGLAAAATKARLSLGPDKNAPFAGSAAAEAQG